MPRAVSPAVGGRWWRPRPAAEGGNYSSHQPPRPSRGSAGEGHARPLPPPRLLGAGMAAGPRVVSRACRHRQPSAGTAAPRGAGTAGGGAGHSCAPPRLSIGVRGGNGALPTPPWRVERGEAGLRWAPRLPLAAWTGLRPSPCGGCFWQHGLARAMLGSQILIALVPVLPQQRLREGG